MWQRSHMNFKVWNDQLLLHVNINLHIIGMYSNCDVDPTCKYLSWLIKKCDDTSICNTYGDFIRVGIVISHVVPTVNSLRL